MGIIRIRKLKVPWREGEYIVYHGQKTRVCKNNNDVREEVLGWLAHELGE